MTTAATVAGHAPLIFATGPGAGARNSIGWVIVMGMIIGTAFTLFVVPSFYMLLARNRSHMHDGGNRAWTSKKPANASKSRPQLAEV